MNLQRDEQCNVHLHLGLAHQVIYNKNVLQLFHVTLHPYQLIQLEKYFHSLMIFHFQLENFFTVISGISGAVIDISPLLAVTLIPFSPLIK